MEEIYKPLTKIITEAKNEYIFNNYEVSNFGNVRNNKTYKILKQQKTKDDYSIISLNDINKKKRTLRVHRLVALLFIENPNNYDQINHKDGNKNNNSVDNLEWCNSTQNVKHMVENNLSNFKEKLHKASIEGKITGINQPKKVKLIDRFTNEELIFDSCAEAARFLNAPNGSSISRVANHERNYYKNYFCVYID